MIGDKKIEMLYETVIKGNIKPSTIIVLLPILISNCENVRQLLSGHHLTAGDEILLKSILSRFNCIFYVSRYFTPGSAEMAFRPVPI